MDFILFQPLLSIEIHSFVMTASGVWTEPKFRRSFLVTHLTYQNNTRNRARISQEFEIYNQPGDMGTRLGGEWRIVDLLHPTKVVEVLFFAKRRHFEETLLTSCQ
jgi:hypothetical protein